MGSFQFVLRAKMTLDPRTWLVLNCVSDKSNDLLEPGSTYSKNIWLEGASGSPTLRHTRLTWKVCYNVRHGGSHL